jgi:hypothetical protein
LQPHTLKKRFTLVSIKHMTHILKTMIIESSSKLSRDNSKNFGYIFNTNALSSMTVDKYADLMLQTILKISLNFFEHGTCLKVTTMCQTVS